MDGDDRHRKQYGSSGYQSSTAMGAGHGQRMPVPSSERFRLPAQAISRGESSSSSMTRSTHLPTYGGYGYPEQQAYTAQALQGSNVPTSNMQYQAEFPQEPSRQPMAAQQSPQQQFPQYGANIIYGMGQTVPHQSPYDTVPQYQHRQNAALEVLSNQFGGQQYFASSEPASAGIPAVQPQYITSQVDTASYTQQSPVGRPSMQQSFAVGVPEYHAMGPPESLEQQQSSSASDLIDEAYSEYQEHVKVTLEAIRAGRLSEASESLLQLSRWLLNRIVPLGLVHDEPALHADRLQLWSNFNTCWLAIGQKQKDLTQEMLQAGQPILNLLSAAVLQNMVNELVRMNDQIEQHGLVDYDMGVWEEEIVHVFEQCLDLLKSFDDGRRQGTGRPHPSPG